MKILFALTYYLPNISGLTIYVQRLAEALVKKGHEVSVLTSQHNKSLPLEEVLNGVKIVRVPVAFRLSKGVMMPMYPLIALKLIKRHDLVAINLPGTPFESVILPVLSRFIGHKPSTVTYHCDLLLPSGIFNRFIDEVVFTSNCIAGALVDRVVAYTEDYATHSRFLKKFPRKREVIPPPVIVEDATSEEVEKFRSLHSPGGEKLIGFAARFATEKGVEYMLEALPVIHKEIPGARVLFVGEYKKVIGEEKYRERMEPLVKQAGESWKFLGVLNAKEMALFYRTCDVTVLPSINSTESFGLVQVESMLCGTPVVASNLPGVRVSVGTTKMGLIVPIKDSPALAGAVVEIIKNRENYIKPLEEIKKHFSLEKTIICYEEMFNELIREA
ncbi:MAG TPA: glycosyltransferase family 4 protein [Candidatus Eremiobacteraeota bacterium]|nr:glycosyltransferase family 4 protein [Candidatus Eremiobacteraeota bacterium]